jgi:hypothetical protein
LHPVAVVGEGSTAFVMPLMLSSDSSTADTTSLRSQF